MSEVYCRVCEQDEDEDPVEQGPQTEADAAATAVLSAVNEDADSPACLATVPASSQSNSSRKKKPTNLLTVESELELPGSRAKIKQCSTKTVAAAGTAVVDPSPKRDIQNNNDRTRSGSIEELEFGDDVSAGLTIEAEGRSPSATELPSGVLDAAAVDSRQLNRVHGSEELPAPQSGNIEEPQQDDAGCRLRRGKLGLPVLSKAASAPASGIADDRNGNEDARDNRSNRNYATLPKVRRNAGQTEGALPAERREITKPSDKFGAISSFANVTLVSVSHPNGSGVRRKVPMRTTPDGTNIYYWCDMSKKTLKGLQSHPYFNRKLFPY